MSKQTTFVRLTLTAGTTTGKMIVTRNQLILIHVVG